jgi:folate-binding Fe-S cluster repair protein YgfZ
MHTTQLDYLAAARFSGKDAGGFLHAQLSADVQALAPGQATFAAYCSPRGQVLGVLLVCRRRDDYLAAASAALLPGMLQRLRLFVLRSQVTLEEAGD